MTELNIKLTVDVVNYLLSVLGELPTRSGAYPIILDIKAQADKQIAEA